MGNSTEYYIWDKKIFKLTKPSAIEFLSSKISRHLKNHVFNQIIIVNPYKCITSRKIKQTFNVVFTKLEWKSE